MRVPEGSYGFLFLILISPFSNSLFHFLVYISFPLLPFVLEALPLLLPDYAKAFCHGLLAKGNQSLSEAYQFNFPFEILISIPIYQSTLL